MSKKIVVSLLSIFLLIGLIMATVNPSTVMAIVGLSSLDVNALEKAQADTVKNLKAELSDMAQNMGSSTKKTYESDDEAVVFNISKSSQDVSVSIEFDGSLLPEMNYKDIGKVIKVAQGYLKPVFSEKQAIGLCGLLIGDAYAQYKKGKVLINIAKEYEGITIKCSGDIDAGRGTVILKSTLGVRQCQPNKSKTTEMKALPL